MSVGLNNVKKTVAQLLGCHDLQTADGESVLKRTAIAQTGNSLYRGHYINGSHPFRNTVLLKL